MRASLSSRWGSGNRYSRLLARLPTLWRANATSPPSPALGRIRRLHHGRAFAVDLVDGDLERRKKRVSFGHPTTIDSPLPLPLFPNLRGIRGLFKLESAPIGWRIASRRTRLRSFRCPTRNRLSTWAGVMKLLSWEFSRSESVNFTSGFDRVVEGKRKNVPVVANFSGRFR